MQSTHTAEPVPTREAFEGADANARRTQAALLLCVGAAVSGRTAHLERSDAFPLPALEPLAHPPPVPLPRAIRRLAVSATDYLAGQVGTIGRDEPARLTRALYDRPDVDTAAALVEAGLHSDDQLVRASAAVAALDTTGPREDVIAELESAAGAGDADIRDIGRIGLARAVPGHPHLQRLTVRRTHIRPRYRLSETAVLSHGTFASRSRWWRPGGTFHTYLDGLTPSLDLHDESFGWSGAYSPAQRLLAADDLIAWVAAQGLDRPDYIAHSHGATVGNLATQRGLQLDRLVLLACPVHTPWLPDLGAVRGLLDVRTRMDLVILADRGRQRLPATIRRDPRVVEARNGWFNHSVVHDPAYWEAHSLPDVLAATGRA